MKEKKEKKKRKEVDGGTSLLLRESNVSGHRIFFFFDSSRQRRNIFCSRKVDCDHARTRTKLITIIRRERTLRHHRYRRHHEDIVINISRRDPLSRPMNLDSYVGK